MVCQWSVRRFLLDIYCNINPALSLEFINANIISTTCTTNIGLLLQMHHGVIMTFTVVDVVVFQSMEQYKLSYTKMGS